MPEVNSNFLQEKIIKQAVAILGASQSFPNSGNKLDNVENLCNGFISSAMEEVFLKINWKSAIETVPKTKGNENSFTLVKTNDCIRIISLAPSNIEWYVLKRELYFRGHNLDSGFYYSGKILKQIKLNENIEMPSSFSTLCSFYLASRIAHTLYADSIFTDGMKKQYLNELSDAKISEHFDYHLVNSSKFM